MASGARGAAFREIERLYGSGSVSGLNEGQLLDRFVARNDAAAFEAIVAQHGPMVMTVCRRWLRDPNDVDDAFQATFLILVRKAGTLRDRGLLGNWLFGVAFKVAARARSTSRRHETTHNLAETLIASEPAHSGDADEPELYEEVHRLPDKYRSPIVLCYLEGLTHEEAAERLNWPVGTVKGRLARARDLLRSRLIRRGVTVASSAPVLEILARDAQALGTLTPRLVEHTIRMAANVSTAVAAGFVSANAFNLSQGVIHVMLVSKLKSLAVAFVVAGTLVTGAGVYAYQGGPAVKNVEKFETAKTRVAAPDVPKPPPVAPAPANPPVLGGGGFGGGGGGGLGSDEMDPHALRIKIAELGPRIAARDKSPKTKAILEKLESPVSMSFANETPLEDVLKYIKSSTQGANNTLIPIYVDPNGLKDAEKTLTSPIVMDMEGVPLKTTLRLLLKQLDLAYCVRDGVLIISSVDGVYQELMEAESENPG